MFAYFCGFTCAGGVVSFDTLELLLVELCDSLPRQLLCAPSSD